MPKFAVMVERLVPQWRVVIVEAESADDIDKDSASGRKVWEAASRLDGWDFDDNADIAQKPSAVEVVEAEEWRVDLSDDADVTL